MKVPPRVPTINIVLEPFWNKSNINNKSPSELNLTDLKGDPLGNLKTGEVNSNRINSDFNEKIKTSLTHSQRLYMFNYLIVSLFHFHSGGL